MGRFENGNLSDFCVRVWKFLNIENVIIEKLIEDLFSLNFKL